MMVLCDVFLLLLAQRPWMKWTRGTGVNLLLFMRVDVKTFILSIF